MKTIQNLFLQINNIICRFRQRWKAAAQGKGFRLQAAVLLGLVLTIFAADFTAFAQGCNDLREDVLRLHILANSDSEEDQALKLKVRDRVLKEGVELFSIGEGKEKAMEEAQKQLKHLIQAAQDEVYRQGYTYQVHGEVVKMYFNTREYDGFTMPAELDDSILKDILGIDPEDVEEYTGYITMVNISTDNLIAIKAKEGKVETVQKKLEERQDAQAKEFEKYLQDQYQKVTVGKVIVIGDYVFLATLCRMDEDPATEAADIETFIRGSFTE